MLGHARENLVDLLGRGFRGNVDLNIYVQRGGIGLGARLSGSLQVGYRGVQRFSFEVRLTLNGTILKLGLSS